MSSPVHSVRAAATLWFPFFFVSAFALMFLLAFAAPAPHDMSIAIVGPATGTTRLSDAIESAAPGGFDIVTDSSRGRAQLALDRNEVAGVYVVNPSGRSQLEVNSAASGTRASFLERFFTQALPGHSGEEAPEVKDVVAKAAGDVSGVGLFFFALPILLVGMITSIVLLQFRDWRTRHKVFVQAATGAFASLFTFAAAVSLGIIPPVFWLVPLGFALTQAIGWLTAATAMLVQRYFMPISMTFVLILNIPSSGGTVNDDMVPPFIAVLHDILPFGQFIEATRSIAYFGGAGAAGPVLALLAWSAGGAALLIFAHHRTRTRQASPSLDAADSQEPQSSAIQPSLTP